MEKEGRVLNYLELLDALAALEGKRVRVAAFVRGSVTPLAVFGGTLGRTTMSQGHYRDDVQGVACLPFLGDDDSDHPQTGPQGLYLDASQFESARVLLGSLRARVAGVEIVVVPS